MAQQPGFIYHSLSVDDEGLWHAIIYWQSLQQAKAAGEKFMQAECGQAIMALVDADSTKMRRMQACQETQCEAA